MHALSRQLASTRGVEKILQVAVKHISEIFESQVAALLPDEKGRLHVAAGDLCRVSQRYYQRTERGPMDLQRRPDGRMGDPNLAHRRNSLCTLAGGQCHLRGFGLAAQRSQRLFLPEQLRLLESLAKQMPWLWKWSACKRRRLEAQIDAETERLRSSLLGSVTHDFQTPLAAIMGSASSLLDLQGQLDAKLAQEMLTNIYGEAERLSRLVNNLLDIAKLESGALKLHKELQPLEEVVGAALNRLEKKLADRP